VEFAMNLFHACVRSPITITAGVLVVLFAAVPHATAQAEDGAFLACARHTDRGERIACLEDALDDALAAQEAAGRQDDAASSEAPAIATEEPVERSSLLNRIRSFGQRDEAASISTDASGNERLNDTISALEKRNDLWLVTLSTGQVWRQAYPRSLNLRVGDAISIYQDGIGNGYRLATPRLSGFIRVERIR
jgi:hypothetical protein